MAHSKRIVDALKRFDRQQLHGPGEAIDLVKSLASTKFDETIELAVRLGVDPNKQDQRLRSTISLPGGTGQQVRVAVFASGPAAEEARAAGADFVGADDLVERVQGGWFEFDRAIATPEMMGLVGRVARILGPRQLLPNPKEGTVTTDVGKAVAEVKGGRVKYKTDKYGIVHVPIGKASFDRRPLLDNIHAVIEELQRSKPAASKGRYIRSIAVSPSMGPGVKIDPARIKETQEDAVAAS